MLQNKQIKSLFMQNLGTFQLTISVLGPGVGESAWEPFKNCLSDHYSLMGLVDVCPVAFEARCFGGLIPQMQVLKAGVPDMGFKPFTS